MTANFRIGATLRNAAAKTEREKKQMADAEKNITISEKWFAGKDGNFDAVVVKQGKMEMRVGKARFAYEVGPMFILIDRDIRIEKGDGRAVKIIPNLTADSTYVFTFKTKIHQQRFLALAEKAGITITK